MFESSRVPARRGSNRTSRESPRRTRCVLLLAACCPLVAAAQGLGLAEAERIALQRDLVLSQLAAQSEAQAQRAVAAGTRSDPRWRVGAVNLPVDSFEFNADDMSMLEIGVSQEFAPGNSRELARLQLEQADAATHSVADERRLALTRELRRNWTALARLSQSAQLLATQTDWAEQLRRSARTRYAAGQGRQLDLLRAGLDAASLRERQLETERETAARRGELARWLGAEDAARAGPFTLPAAPALAPLAELEARLDAHPRLRDAGHRIDAAQTAVEFARVSARPGWMLDLSYGMRSGREPGGESRADMVSAMVSVDLPFNRAERQDRELAAARAELRGLNDAQADLRRELQARLAVTWHDARRIDALLALYADELLPLAGQSVQAALLAWSHDRGSLEEVVEARGLALDAALTQARLLGERSDAQHELDYLLGEIP